MDKYAFVISNASVLLIVGVAVQLWFSARLFVLSHAMFMAVGAYTAVALGDADMPLVVCLLGGVAASIVVGLVFSYLLLRLENLHLALASLALSALAGILLLKWEGLTGGPNGRVLPVTMSWEPLLVIAVAVLAFSWWLQRHWSGPLSLIRFDPRVARSTGVHAKAYQRTFFVIGAAIAGLAGSLQAQYLLFLSASTFNFTLILTGLIIAVLGAREHWFGPVVGVFVMGILPEIFRGLQQYSVVVAGVLLILVMQYFPFGVVPPALRWFRRLRGGRDDDRVDAVAAADPARVLDLTGRERPEQTDTGVALKVSNLTVRYGGIAAVRDLTFDVRPGEVLGIIGPNGAGKTTLINALTGFVVPAEGSVAIGGRDITGATTEARAEAGMVRTFQHAQFAPDLTLGENVAAGKLLRFPAPLGLSRSWSKVRAGGDELISALGLHRSADQPPDSAPLGTRRIAEMARALLARPSVLLLDEPTAGMDEAALELFVGLVDQAASTGTAVVLISHDIGIVQRVSDRVLVMSFGEELAVLPAHEMLRDERVVEAYLGATV
jgi:ABC-type branched-subunit amino acid transport system ATPase component/ABC-type branched-subunit amino acid transport system permease subunit